MAVWNPSDKGSNITLSGGNLTAAQSTNTYHAVRCDESRSSGKWYWEVTIDAMTAGGWVGLADATASMTAGAGGGGLHLGPNAVGLGIFNGGIYFNGSEIFDGAGFSAGQIVGIAWDADAKTVQFYKNGVAFGSAVTSTNMPSSGTLYPCVWGQNTAGAMQFTANFGATAFTYTPPVGYSGLDEPPLDFSLTMDAAVTVDGASDLIEFEPLELVMDAAVTVDATADVIEEIVVAMEADVSVDATGDVFFPVPLLVIHTMDLAVSVDGSSPYDGPEIMNAAVSVDASADLEFVTTDTGEIEAVAPLPTASLAGVMGNSATIVARAPLATAVLVGGAQNIITRAPLSTVSFTAFVGGNATIDAEAPATAAEITALVGPYGTVEASAPAATAVLTAQQTAVATIAATSPAARASLTAQVVVSGTITATSPAATASLRGSPQIVATIVATVPVSRAVFGESVDDALGEYLRAMVVNSITSAVTEYDSFEFDSFCQIGGVTYAAGTDGIYEMDTGLTDDGAAIDASFESGCLDFKSEYLKRFESLYAAYRTTGDLHVTVSTDEGREYTYVMRYDGVQTLKQRRVPIGKGLKGKYWTIRVANVNGSGFGLDTMNALAHETVRRIAA